MNRTDFKCQNCGRCCIELLHEILACIVEDIERWEREGRTDILQYCQQTEFGGELWLDPQADFGWLPRCPFLRQTKSGHECEIEDAKPFVCQTFPFLEYDEDGNLDGVHEWAVENCPAVRELLKGWTPEQTQALRPTLADLADPCPDYDEFGKPIRELDWSDWIKHPEYVDPPEGDWWC